MTDPTALAYASAAAAKHNVTVEDILAPTRSKPHIVKARWEAWSYARRAGWTLDNIGDAFGRHHTTVMHGLREFEAMSEATGTTSTRGSQPMPVF